MKHPEKTGLPRYSDGQNQVWAAKIIGVEPYNLRGVGTCNKLAFDNGRQSNVVPEWVSQYSPQAGGYFIVDYGEGARYMNGEEFEKRLKAKP